MIPTYQGEIAPDQLGVTLMHEHVFVMSAELAMNYPEFTDWDEERVVVDAVRRLEQLKAVGIDTLVDMTVLGLGRMPALVARVAEQTDVRIIGATGVYALRDLPLYLKLRGPGLMFDEPEPMVAMFVKDLTVGIGSTGVRAGILKCATDKAGMTPDVMRVVRAVACAHVETGAPISTHTNAVKCTGLDQIEVFRAEGVDLGKVIIGHSGDTGDLDYLRRLIDAGCLLGMDRFGLSAYRSFEDRIATVARLCDLGYADRIVLSHDAACHNDALDAEAFRGREPNHHFRHIGEDVLPALPRCGGHATQIEQMLVDNPRCGAHMSPPRMMTRWP